ncbi:ectonucleotide pyrophosphatase/phosphodiesterase family member 5-like [Ylistrum balloti]|uniref:ectonucleotide pyrophosphatase/phosphodiesterase family member 5-like n=1 Tax=Ylistrum balloti TaxID=509963 RepID=UPI002905C020|nr:ectonucleotide pyrophosphatase/phosphodiesterase family member 5-like [Ylistrum balloti]
MAPRHVIITMVLTIVFTNRVIPKFYKKYPKQVILVSMDGFRYDYHEKANTPNFDEIERNGVKAKYVNSTFTTKTLPSHYSIATGLYQESHGIIANDMYDPEFNDMFSIELFPDSKWWTQGEPIWITARKHGLKTGTIHWPGGYIEIQGMRANKIHKYNKSVPFEHRLDIAIEMLVKDNFNFVALYFHEPDNTGHKFGPQSKELVKMVEEMDSLLGKLLNKLEDNGLKDSVNLIVASDHGMTATNWDNKLINIYDVVHRTMIITTLEIGPVMQLIPVEGQEDEVVNAINKNANLRAYKKEDIPEVWHYKNNRRVMPVLIVANEGWTITNDTELSRKIGRIGDHGYDNSLITMQPIFYAMGPNFHSGFSAPPFRTIDIYPMICKLLGIPPAPNNGTLDNTISFLLTSHDGPQICNGLNLEEKNRFP